MKVQPLWVVQLCYNLLIPLQIVAALYIDKGDLLRAGLLILGLMILESVGIRYWIIAQSKHLRGH